MQVNSSASARPIKLAQGIVGSPRISGDGSTVVWNQIVNDNLEIMRYHDGKVEQLSHDDRADMHASVNYDGSVVAWTRFNKVDPQDQSGRWDIVVWKNGVETTLADSSANAIDPTVSRDGKVVAWSDDKDGSFLNWKIQRWENGRVEDVTDQGNNAFPVLNGDGSRLFWRNFDDHGGSDLWMRDQQGTVKPLTYDPQAEVMPVCTPDGKTLIFSKQAPQGDDDLYRFDLEPGSRPQLSLVSGQRKMDETWATTSADARQVVWTNFDRRKEECDTQIYLRDGDSVTPLTSDHALHSYPQISDNGQKVAWMWMDLVDSDKRAIYLLDRQAGSAPTRA